MSSKCRVRLIANTSPSCTSTSAKPNEIGQICRHIGLHVLHSALQGGQLKYIEPPNA